MRIDRDRIGLSVEEVRDARPYFVDDRNEPSAHLECERRGGFPALIASDSNDSGATADPCRASVSPFACDLDAAGGSGAQKPEERIPRDRRAIRDRNAR